MSVRFGVSPIAWINDDLPALGGNTPLESVLGEARDAGFAGIELGGKFPKDANVLQALLRRYQTGVGRRMVQRQPADPFGRGGNRGVAISLEAAQGDGLRRVHSCRDQQCHSLRSRQRDVSDTAPPRLVLG